MHLFGYVCDVLRSECSAAEAAERVRRFDPTIRPDILNPQSPADQQRDKREYDSKKEYAVKGLLSTTAPLTPNNFLDFGDLRRRLSSRRGRVPAVQLRNIPDLSAGVCEERKFKTEMHLRISRATQEGAESCTRTMGDSQT